MKIFILASAIIVASFGITTDSFAATYNVSPGVAGSLCSGNYAGRNCKPNTAMNVNISHAGQYTVSVRVERGNNIGLYECQGRESFYMDINGQRTPVVRDPDACEWSGTVKTQQVSGQYSLKQGNNVIQLFHAHVGERNIGIESMSVEMISFVSVALPSVNGACGSAVDGTFDVAPTSGLCERGTFFGMSATNTTWNWSCNGINGGSPAPCSANITDAPICGDSNEEVFDTIPTSEFCLIGNESNISGGGPWNWICTNGVRTVPCSADITPEPECGDSNDQVFSAVPTSELCSVGFASEVDGADMWSWTCTNGVRTRDCSATYAQAAIQIIKTNGTDNGDSQTMETGEDASFTITVRNVGEEILSDITVTDEEASQCGRSASQTEALFEGSLFDAGESFTYTCVDTNVTSSYTNIAGVVANATTSSITVTDRDPSDVVVSDPEEPVTPDPTPEPEEEEEEDDDGAIGNFVWHDRNKDGVQDPGEEGITGVKIKLYNGNDVETDRTNSRGRYKFKELDPGQYRIVVAEETLPEGCYQTYDKDGTLDNKIKTRITGDEYYRKADFGYYCPGDAPVTKTSPQTGAGTTAGMVSFIAAALSAGFVYRRNTKQNA